MKTEKEFFAAHNFRSVEPLRCCRKCKHRKEKFYEITSNLSDSDFVSTTSSYWYCGHPGIDQSEYPSPVSKFGLCDMFEEKEYNE